MEGKEEKEEEEEEEEEEKWWVRERQGWDDHLAELLHVHAHAHTPLTHSLPRTQPDISLTFYSLSFDMGCYCADSSDREG